MKHSYQTRRLLATRDIRHDGQNVIAGGEVFATETDASYLIRMGNAKDPGAAPAAAASAARRGPGRPPKVMPQLTPATTAAGTALTDTGSDAGSGGHETQKPAAVHDEASGSSESGDQTVA